MKVIVRVIGIAALLLVQQLVVAPLIGRAQVDPCNPVPIPGLCPQPSPSPSESPSPAPAPAQAPAEGGGTVDKDADRGKGGGKAKGGKAQRGGQKGKGGKRAKGPPVHPRPTGPFRVSAPNNSQELVEMLSQLDRYGVPLQEAVLRVAGPFPVAGLAYWTDDWHACRDGCKRLHEGLDIFALPDTPLVSIADGFVSQKLVGKLSGTSIEITDAQGVQYFYAHLSAWAEPIRVGDQVEMGQVIGYLGNTGNAIFTPPHLHLEVQPGGIPVPPKPFVDRWLKIAELEAQQLVARYTGKPLPEASSFRVTRQFDLTGGGDVLEAGAQRLLALAGIQPSVSSLELARRLLGEMAWEIDWAGQADAELAALAQQYAGALGAQDLSGASPWSPLGAPPAATEGLDATVTGELGD